MAATSVAVPQVNETLADSPEALAQAFRGAGVSIVVLGASGDLAKKKTLPALFGLFLHNLLPRHAVILGYARSELTREEFHAKLRPFLAKAGAAGDVDAFLSRCHYKAGSYDKREVRFLIQPCVLFFSSLFNRLEARRADACRPAPSMAPPRFCLRRRTLPR